MKTPWNTHTWHLFKRKWLDAILPHQHVCECDSFTCYTVSLGMDGMFGSLAWSLTLTPPGNVHTLKSSTESWANTQGRILTFTLGEPLCMWMSDLNKMNRPQIYKWTTSGLLNVTRQFYEQPQNGENKLNQVLSLWLSVSLSFACFPNIWNDFSYSGFARAQRWFTLLHDVEGMLGLPWWADASMHPSS